MKKTTNYQILNLGLGDQPKEEENLEWKTTSKNESGTTDIIGYYSNFNLSYISSYIRA